MYENLLLLILISLSLSMDCFAVSCAVAFREKNIKKRNFYRMASSFGLFQTSMAIMGFLIGKFMHSFIKAIDHWIAFSLLLIIGAKMIYETFEKDENKIKYEPFKIKEVLALSIATSIDSFGVGFTLSLLGFGILKPALLFGFTSFLITSLGFQIGKKLKKYLGKKVEIFGGIILIAIGFKILFEHLK